MKKISKKNLLVVMVTGMLALAGCDEDLTEPEEDHAEPDGVQLVMNGQTLASYDGHDQTWTSGLEVAVGEETAHIGVIFVDHDGDAIPIDDDLYLDAQVQDESIADFHQDEPGEFGGHLDGIAAGRTGIAFRLMHGTVGSGHPDFETTPVGVQVVLEQN